MNGGDDEDVAGNPRNPANDPAQLTRSARHDRAARLASPGYDVTRDGIFGPKSWAVLLDRVQSFRSSNTMFARCFRSWDSLRSSIADHETAIRSATQASVLIARTVPFMTPDKSLGGLLKPNVVSLRDHANPAGEKLNNP